jgi:branched-chain amino acid transport system ATP-binding protein
MTENGNALLNVNNIEMIYDRVILMLKGVSFAVPQGGIVALLGANGAGKTTTLKAVSNLLKAERGVVQVMEGRHCFEHLTIETNLMTGAYTRR